MDLNEAMEEFEHESEGECIHCTEKKCKKELLNFVIELVQDNDITWTHMIGILHSVTDKVTTWINNQEAEEYEESQEDENE